MPLTLGVEEEFFGVDPTSRWILADTRPILAAARASVAEGATRYDDELRTCMLEGRTTVCRSLDEVRTELRTVRRGLTSAAEGLGLRVAAAGTLPLVDWRTLPFTPKGRHQQVVEAYGQMTSEHVICACHVHVGIDDRETALQVLNRVGRWLPVLSALSGSSPFWMGEDTGYASYRTMVWARWPMAGPTPHFESHAAYSAGVQALVDTRTIADWAQLYWDARLGTRYDTVEFRIADSCPTVDDTVLQAGLCRALARTCLEEVGRGDPPARIRPELLLAARWRAARYGLEGTLLDPGSGQVVPAADLVDRFLAYVRDALEEAGDTEEITALVERAKGSGTSAARQRRLFQQTGRLEDVVDMLVEETATPA